MKIGILYTYACVFICLGYISASAFFFSKSFPQDHRPTAYILHPQFPINCFGCAQAVGAGGGDLPSRNHYQAGGGARGARRHLPWRFRAPTRQSRLGGERELLRGLALINPPTGRRQRMEKQPICSIKPDYRQNPTKFVLLFPSRFYLIYFADFFVSILNNKTGCSPLTNLLCSNMSHAKLIPFLSAWKN